MPRQLDGFVLFRLQSSPERSDASEMVMQLVLEKERQSRAEWFNKVDVIESAGWDELRLQAERSERWAAPIGRGGGFSAGQEWAMWGDFGNPQNPTEA